MQFSTLVRFATDECSPEERKLFNDCERWVQYRDPEDDPEYDALANIRRKSLLLNTPWTLEGIMDIIEAWSTIWSEAQKQIKILKEEEPINKNHKFVIESHLNAAQQLDRDVSMLLDRMQRAKAKMVRCNDYGEYRELKDGDIN